MAHRHHFGDLAVLLPLAALVLLTGCTATEPAPAAGSSPTSPETAAPAPVVDPGPTSRIDADCDELIELSALQAFVGGTGAPLVAVAIAERLTPDDAAVLQLGGLLCEWSNVAEPAPWGGSPTGAQQVSLRVLPEGVEQAAAYVAAFDEADPTYGEHVQGPRCSAPVEGGRTSGYCELMGAVGPTWVELQLSGIAPQPGATDASLRDAFRASVTDSLVADLQATALGPRWAPLQASEVASCEIALPVAEVAELTGFADAAFGVTRDGPSIGQYVYATEQTGAARCSIHPTAALDATFGEVVLLPDGGWAFERYREDWIASGGAEQPVVGVPSGAAVVRCVDDTAVCRLDLTVDGDWIAIVFPPMSDGSAPSLPGVDYEAARGAMVPIAEAIAANLAAA